MRTIRSTTRTSTSHRLKMAWYSCTNRNQPRTTKKAKEEKEMRQTTAAECTDRLSTWCCDWTKWHHPRPNPTSCHPPSPTTTKQNDTLTLYLTDICAFHVRNGIRDDDRLPLLSQTTSRMRLVQPRLPTRANNAPEIVTAPVGSWNSLSSCPLQLDRYFQQHKGQDWFHIRSASSS